MVMLNRMNNRLLKPVFGEIEKNTRNQWTLYQSFLELHLVINLPLDKTKKLQKLFFSSLALYRSRFHSMMCLLISSRVYLCMLSHVLFSFLIYTASIDMMRKKNSVVFFFVFFFVSFLDYFVFSN